jgi:excisionase family DNA binding protein
MNLSELKDDQIIQITKQDLMEAFSVLMKNHEPEISTEHYITIDQVSKITGYKRPTLYRFVALKQIPHYKRKGRICFKTKEIDEWMNEGKREV